MKVAPVDVVVPVQDVDAYLEEALQSIAAQSVPVASIVVVDAGSHRPVELDPALATLCTLVRRHERLFSGAARNIGAALGRAPWLAFLDADDLWPAERTARLLEAAANAQARWVYGTVESFAGPGATGRLRLPPVAPGMLAGAGLVWRAEFTAAGGFDPTLALGEFVDLAARLRHRAVPETAVDDVTLRRRIHPQSTTVRRQAGRDAYLTVVRSHLARRTDPTHGR